MILPNGTAEFLRDVTGAIDPDTGYVLRLEDGGWGDPIPCQAVTSDYDALAATQTTGSSYTERHYQLLFDGQPQTTGTLRLTTADCNGVVFAVKRHEFWAAVMQTCVWV